MFLFETKESFYGYKNQSNNYHHLNSHPENIDAIIVEFMICCVHYRVDMEVVNSEIIISDVDIGYLKIVFGF